MIRTASGKEQALVDFYAQISRDAAARPGVFAGTATELAVQARVGRAHLAKLLGGGSQGRHSGRHTWKHLMPLLSVQALFHLKQCSAWNIHAQQAFEAHCWMEWRTERLESDFGTIRFVRHHMPLAEWPAA